MLNDEADLESEDADSADDGAIVQCPYCGEAVEIAVDASGGSTQRYVEDCQVCCQPWQVIVRVNRNGRAKVTVSALNE
jgi:hypothetical protein